MIQHQYNQGQGNMNYQGQPNPYNQSQTYGMQYNHGQGNMNYQGQPNPYDQSQTHGMQYNHGQGNMNYQGQPNLYNQSQGNMNYQGQNPYDQSQTYGMQYNHGQGNMNYEGQPNLYNQSQIHRMPTGEPSPDDLNVSSDLNKAVTENNPDRISANSQKNDDNKKKGILIGGIIGAVVLLLVIVIMITGGNKQDTDQIINETVKEEVVEETMAEEMSIEEQVSNEATVEEQIPATNEDLLINAEWTDFLFELEGVTYQLPVSYTDFKSMGWSINDYSRTEDTILAAESYENVKVTNGIVEIYAYIYNASGNSKALKDCNVGGLSIVAKNNLDFALAKRIDYSSTTEEIMEAYGTPSSTNTYDDYTLLRYEKDSDVKAKMTFYVYTTNTAQNQIEIQYFPVTSADVTEVSTERPEYLDTYVAPVALENAPWVPQFELDGALYQLPCPLAEFEKNGWTIAAKSEDTLGSNNSSYGAIKIKKGNNELYLDMYNFSMNAEMLENCAVTGVNFDIWYLKEYTADFVKMPGGLNLGATMEEVENVVAGSEYEFEKYEGSSTVSYTCNVWNDNTTLVVKYLFNTGAGINPTPSIKVQFDYWGY